MSTCLNGRVGATDLSRGGLAPSGHHLQSDVGLEVGDVPAVHVEHLLVQIVRDDGASYSGQDLPLSLHVVVFGDVEECVLETLKSLFGHGALLGHVQDHTECTSLLSFSGPHLLEMRLVVLTSFEENFGHCLMEWFEFGHGLHPFLVGQWLSIYLN